MSRAESDFHVEYINGIVLTAQNDGEFLEQVGFLQEVMGLDLHYTPPKARVHRVGCRVSTAWGAVCATDIAGVMGVARMLRASRE